MYVYIYIYNMYIHIYTYRCIHECGSVCLNCEHDVPFEAYTVAGDLRTVQEAMKWFSKHVQAQLLPGECLTNCRSLRILACRHPQEVLLIVLCVCASRMPALPACLPASL